MNITYVWRPNVKQSHLIIIINRPEQFRLVVIVVFYRLSKYYVFRMTFVPRSILLKNVYYHEPVDIFINGWSNTQKRSNGGRTKNFPCGNTPKISFKLYQRIARRRGMIFPWQNMIYNRLWVLTVVKKKRFFFQNTLIIHTNNIVRHYVVNGGAF